MAENPYPIPRQLRQSEILLGDGGDTYGPFDFEIFDLADVVVCAQAADELRFTEVAGMTVTKVNGNNVLNPLDKFSVKFPSNVPNTTRYIVFSSRVAARDAGVISGTRINPDALEKEFSKIATEQQELRRDVGRSIMVEFGQNGLVLDAGLQDGSTLMKQGDRIVVGPNAGQIASAQGYAEDAQESSASALEYKNAAVAAAATSHNPQKWFVVTAAPYNGPVYTSRAAALAGVHLGTALRQACLDAHAQGGGIVYIPAGWYLCDRGFDIRALSNVHIMGAGKGITNIVAAASLDGRDNDFYNDVFMGLNFTAYDAVKGGYVWKNLGVSDMTIDCMLQNPNAIVLDPPAFGRSLAAVEIMNVDSAFIKRVEVIGAYGNGLVISSADPRLYDANGVRVGVLDPVMEDNDFIGCLRGLLPQYPGPETPGGITGTVIQIGAAVGGHIHRSKFRNSGGPLIDRFNCDGLDIDGVDVDGFGTTPVGTNASGTSYYTQGVNHIRSDFGLKNGRVRNVVMRNGGGVYDRGMMVPTFFNGEIRTPGPSGCVYENITIEDAKGKLQIAAPALGGSGEHYTHRGAFDKYTHPVMIQFYNWEVAGVTVSLNRGGLGTWTALPISPNGVIVIRRSDEIAVMYTAAGWSWAWFLCPNADQAGLHLDGGSVTGHIGSARNNVIQNCNIKGAGSHAIEIVDGLDNIIQDSKLLNVGLTAERFGVLAVASYPAESGAGSSRNICLRNSASDDRNVSRLAGLWSSDAVSQNNRIEDNWIGVLYPGATVAGVKSSSPTNFHKGNKGPGSSSSVLGAQPSMSAPNADFPNPFNFDCYVTVAGATALATGKLGATAANGSSTFAHVPHGECIRVSHGGGAQWTWVAAP